MGEKERKHRKMGKKKKWEDEPVSFNYPVDNAEWTATMSDDELREREAKVRRREKRRTEKAKRKMKPPPGDEQQEVVTTPDPGPAPPEDIREVFEWHEQRLSKRGLEPEGLKRGVTIQHKFDNGEVLTASKAEEGLTKAPEYGIRGWTKSQVEQFKRAGWIMNGYLGEEGQYGYLAGSAGGVQNKAKRIKAENPLFKREELALLKQREAQSDGQTYEELQVLRTRQFKEFIEREQARKEAEHEAKQAERRKHAKLTQKTIR